MEKLFEETHQARKKKWHDKTKENEPKKEKNEKERSE